MNCIAIPFTNHKERFKAVSTLEVEMNKKFKMVGSRKNYRITALDNCVMCEYKDLDRIYY